MVEAVVKREKTWIPVLLGLDILLYGLFDTYTKLASTQADRLGYFVDFPGMVAQFWESHSRILDINTWNMGQAQYLLNALSSFFINNILAIVFCMFIICTIGLIVAMTRYYPAFLSISYGIFAGVALIGFYEGMANIAAMYGLSILGPNSWVSVAIMIPATGFGLLKTYNIDIWGELVTRFPGLLPEKKKGSEPVPRHLANEYSLDYKPEISNDLPEYKDILKRLAEGEFGSHSSPAYIRQVNDVATQYHLDPARVAYDAYALSKKEEAKAGQE